MKINCEIEDYLEKKKRFLEEARNLVEKRKKILQETQIV